MAAEVAEPPTTAVVTEDPRPAEAAAASQEAAPPSREPILTGRTGLELTTLTDMYRFAEYVHASGWGPKGSTPESLVVAIQAGAEVGVTAMQAIRNITPINGTPCIWGDLPLALCMGSPYFDHAEFKEWFTGTEGADHYTAHCQARRRGGNVAEETFSVADAKRAGLWEGAHSVGQRQTPKDTIWYKYFKRMLKYRARAFCLRDTFPDVLKGLHTGEEMSDVEQIMSRLDLGRRSEAPTTESTADLRDKLTDKGKVAAKAKKTAKPKPEPAAPPSESPAGADPDVISKMINDIAKLWQRIPLGQRGAALKNLGLGVYTDIAQITDIKPLREILEAFEGEAAPDGAK